jgi:hypothetical protein
VKKYWKHDIKVSIAMRVSFFTLLLLYGQHAVAAVSGTGLTAQKVFHSQNPNTLAEIPTINVNDTVSGSLHATAWALIVSQNMIASRYFPVDP